MGERFTGPGGDSIHAGIRIGDSVVMISEGAVDGPVSSSGRLGGMVICVMALYREDVDAAWQRAVAAGAEVIYLLEDVFLRRARQPAAWLVRPAVDDKPAPRGRPAEEMARRPAALFSQ